MRLCIALLATIALLSAACAHEEGGHRHQHELHHWESREMRHELLTQIGGMVTLGVAVGSYLLLRRRTSA